MKRSQLVDWQNWRRHIQSAPGRQGGGWPVVVVIAVALAYGWLLTVAGEPRLEPKPTVVSSVAWIENGVVKNWREVRGHRALEVGIVSRTLEALEGRLSIIGGFDRAPALLIDVDRPSRYAVSDTSIEISEAIAIADGQLTKAFLKSWLLQRGASSSRDSLLRFEVITDVLGAMLTGQARLELAGPSVQTADFSEVSSWLREVASAASLCGSVWASLELQGHCGKSEAINALAFRRLLAAMVWRTYTALPLWDRLPVTRAWVSMLREGEIETSSQGATVFPLGWREHLRREFNSIFPVAKIAQKVDLAPEDREDFLAGSFEAERSGDLNGGGGPKVGFVFRGEIEGAQVISSQRSHIVIDRSGLGRLLPGGATLGEIEMRALTAETLLREACDNRVTVGDLLDEPVKAKRALFVYSCANSERVFLGWSAFARGGLTELSFRRPEVGLVQINLEQARFAIRRGVLKSETPMRDLFERRGDSMLGLDLAEWRKEMKAYRVIGAIEAVEWVRPPSPEARPSNERPSNTRVISRQSVY